MSCLHSWHTFENFWSTNDLHTVQSRNASTQLAGCSHYTLHYFLNVKSLHKVKWCFGGAPSPVHIRCGYECGLKICLGKRLQCTAQVTHGPTCWLCRLHNMHISSTVADLEIVFCRIMKNMTPQQLMISLSDISMGSINFTVIPYTKNDKMILLN